MTLWRENTICFSIQKTGGSYVGQSVSADKYDPYPFRVLHEP